MAQTEDVDNLVQQAAKMFWHGPDYPKARPALQHIIGISPDNITAQWFLFMCELIDGDLSAARARGETLLKLAPNSPGMILSLVRAQVAGGDVAAGRAAIKQHLIRDDLRADRRNLSTNQLTEAVLLELTGQHEESFEASRAMCREDDVSLIDWSSIAEAGEIRDAVAHMRAKLRHRDICIFGRGPSIKELEADPGRLSGHDFVPFVMSEFGEVRDRVLAKAGKVPGLVCMTSQVVVHAVSYDLRALCASEQFLGMAVPDFLIQNMLDSDADRDLAQEIFADRRRILPYRCRGEIDLPLPCNPLVFPTVNTVLHALGLAVLLEPRRIFMFGFDGQASPAGEYYYAEDYKASYMGDGWQRRTASWLWWDSFRFNHLAPCFVNHLHLLHDAPFPLIYNVCKNSAIDCFPRIDLNEYSRLTKASS